MSIALAGVIGAVLIGIALENYLGMPFAATYRIACAAACLTFVFTLAKDYPNDRWPRLAFLICLFVNVLLFFTPVVDRPASRGELLVFALPDAIIVLTLLISSYEVVDVRQRAIRQNMILGLIVAIVFCAVLFFLMLNAPAR